MDEDLYCIIVALNKLNEELCWLNHHNLREKFDILRVREVSLLERYLIQINGMILTDCDPHSIIIKCDSDTWNDISKHFEFTI